MKSVGADGLAGCIEVSQDTPYLPLPTGPLLRLIALKLKVGVANGGNTTTLSDVPNCMKPLHQTALLKEAPEETARNRCTKLHCSKKLQGKSSPTPTQVAARRIAATAGKTSERKLLGNLQRSATKRARRAGASKGMLILERTCGKARARG